MNRDIVAQFIKMLTNLDQCLAKAGPMPPPRNSMWRTSSAIG